MDRPHPLSLRGVKLGFWGGEWASLQAGWATVGQMRAESWASWCPSHHSLAMCAGHKPQRHRALCSTQFKISQALLHSKKCQATLLKWTHVPGRSVKATW